VFTWDVSGSLPRLLQDSYLDYLYGPSVGSAPIEQITISTGTHNYLVSDPTGVREAISSSGSIAGSMSYDSYGRPCSCSIDTWFGFEGGYTDATGLIYLINRYYDPATGQFLSVDPDVAATGAPYAFANSDPVNGADSDGLLPTCDYVPTACGLNQNHEPAIGSRGPFADASTSAFPPPPASAVDDTVFPPAPVSGYTPPPSPAPPRSTGPTRAQEVDWAITNITNQTCQYVNDGDVDDAGGDCTVRNILGAGGFFDCTTTSAEGGCYIDWVSINSALHPQDLIGGSGAWGPILISGLDGCSEGGFLGGSGGAAAGFVGAVPGAIVGCIFGGGAEVGAGIIIQNQVG
jgi:RHS repeat-associated protein